MEEARTRFMRLRWTTGATKHARSSDENLEAFEKERRRRTRSEAHPKRRGPQSSGVQVHEPDVRPDGEKYEEWYLFQIIYIVMAIPDIVAQTEDISTRRTTVRRG